MTSFDIENVYVAVGGVAVVQGVSLSLMSGEIALLKGRNGSGKSSLVHALMGHPSYRITHGTVRLDHEDITALPVEARARKGLFLTLQHVPKIGGVTLATFLHAASEVVHCREVPALDFYLELRETAERMGLNVSLLDRPVTEGLSGGERKQAELLQLVALQPRFAILDEIDSGVDSVALQSMYETIRYVSTRGTGFLIISHHPHTEDMFPSAHVYTMHDGSQTTP